MHQTAGRSAGLTAVHFGFGPEHLFVRVDAEGQILDLLAEGREISLKFLSPAGVRYSIRQDVGRLVGGWWERRDEDRSVRWIARGPGDAAVAAGTILEVALPVRDLHVAPGDLVTFLVAVYLRDVEVERHPAYRPIALRVPGAGFSAEQWRA